MADAYSPSSEKNQAESDVGLEPPFPSTITGNGEPAYHTHRKLLGRHLQLLAIAGSIGSGLFVTIGGSLAAAGPVLLLLAMIIWSTVVCAVASFEMELVTFLPIDGGFIRFASRYVSDAFGAALGVNYCVTQLFLIPYELIVLGNIVSYWKDVNIAILISASIAFFAILNLWSVRFYGESEFWLALLKIVLILMVFLFTFCTMLGANPQHDRYGFRYWRETPFVSDNGLERFEGFLTALTFAVFGIVGPDYQSLFAGEVENPRRVMPKTYKSTVIRLSVFYIGGAFAIGTVCSAVNPDLLDAIQAGSPGAGQSPYVIAAETLNISGFGSALNALVLCSIIATANDFTYAGSRCLYGLALNRHLPRIFTKVNRNGIPWVAVLFTLAFSGISYLALSAGALRVLNWFIYICTSTQCVTWMAMAFTYIRFDAGLRAQNLRTGFLPARGFYPLICAYYVLIMNVMAIVAIAYYIMLPGGFSALNFMIQFGCVVLFVAVYLFFWALKRKGVHRSAGMDFVSNVAEIEQYTIQCEQERAARPATRLSRLSEIIFRSGT